MSGHAPERSTWTRLGPAGPIAGTILNELGVDMQTIMEILRHTQNSQTKRYVKGRSELSRDAMRLVGDGFLPSPKESTETPTETAARQKARVRLRRRVR